MIVVQFPPPHPPKGKNHTPRHWAQAARLKKDWGKAAGMAWIVAARRNGERPIDFARRVGSPPYSIRVRLPMSRPGAADPHNFTSYEVAWVVDGLIGAGLAPNDTPEFVTVPEPWLVKRSELPLVSVEIECAA